MHAKSSTLYVICDCKFIKYKYRKKFERKRRNFIILALMRLQVIFFPLLCPLRNSLMQILKFECDLYFKEI